MGTLEKSGRQRAKRRNLKRLVLHTINAVGVLHDGILARNVLGAMEKLELKSKRYDLGNIERARKDLVRDGLLVYDKRGILRLTPKGEVQMRIPELSEFGKKSKRRWDGRWRVLTFDVPEYRRGLRDKIRRTLSAIGFVRLQDSVWIYPYDCEDLIILLKADFKIGKDVLYMIVDELEYDGPIRKVFGLTLKSR